MTTSASVVSSASFSLQLRNMLLTVLTKPSFLEPWSTSLSVGGSVICTLQTVVKSMCCYHCTKICLYCRCLRPGSYWSPYQLHWLRKKAPSIYVPTWCHIFLWLLHLSGMAGIYNVAGIRWFLYDLFTQTQRKQSTKWRNCDGRWTDHHWTIRITSSLLPIDDRFKKNYLCCSKHIIVRS